MSLSHRHRVGLLLAGLVIAAPLLASGAATAGTTTITFTGTPPLGISTLACPSTPSATSLTVAANTVVDFVNRTGRPATLWAGNSQKVLPDKSLVPVTFGSGPAAVVVQMVPQCSLDLGKHTSMTVTVLAATAPPTTAPPTTAPPTGGAPVTGPTGGTVTPRAGATDTKSPAPPTIAPTPSTSSAPAGTTSESKSGGNDNDPFAAAATADATKPFIGTVAGPRPARSASGLLTLIATVGVVGVAAAAIRAILAQRANRALPA
jgi:hypothetical protein